MSSQSLLQLMMFDIMVERVTGNLSGAGMTKQTVKVMLRVRIETKDAFAIPGKPHAETRSGHRLADVAFHV